MNRKNLTAAVLAGLAGAAGIVGSAQAVNINPDGLGQVLIYPYYTVNGGNMTLLSVVNTSDEAKAVKVRFMEGKNSREVLDFNLYMSKYDVWTASLKKMVDGTPRLKTTDMTCTVPYIYDKLLDGHDPAEGDGIQVFLPYAMTDEKGYDPKDITTLGDISRATEGHFEMIEMGTLVNDTEASATAATHVKGIPADCGQLVAAWTDPDNTVEDDEGYWLNEAQGPATDLSAPTGGLFGGAAIVNVQAGTMFSYDAKAINGFADSTFGNGDYLHQLPGNVLPSLNSGNISSGTVFMDNGYTHSYGFASGRPVDAISFVFMHDAVMNEYTTETVVGAGTEWVMSFPTKQFYVYQPSAAPADAPVAPFTSEWIPEYSDDAACEVVMLDSIYDREERTVGDPEITGIPVPPLVSPEPPGTDPTLYPEIPLELCYEVSVLEFGPKEELAASGILGSANFHEIDNTLLGFEYGWARLDMTGWEYDLNGDGDVLDDDETFVRMPLGGLTGLPVTGFAVMAFENAFLGDGADVLANYGGIFQHKATRNMGSMMILGQ